MHNRRAGLLTGLAFSLISSSYAFAFGGKAHAEANVDKHRVVYVDAWPVADGKMHIRFTVSNGWKTDPWWITPTAHFISGGVSHDVAFNAKCPASMSGRAHECNYDFERNGALWASFDKLTIDGHNWNGVGRRTPGTNDGPEIGVNVPIYSTNW